tara:strand:- start:348 stop:1232 length:885 start_codon:yes stop_codon:yes gene_type:complete
MLACHALAPVGHCVAPRPRLRGSSIRDDSSANRRRPSLRGFAAAPGREPEFTEEGYDDAECFDDTYGTTIETLLELEASYPAIKRMTRWVSCLAACDLVVGGCDGRFVKIGESKHGAGVFAVTDIPRRQVLGNYPGVRRSLKDYTEKAERTDGKVLSYGLMCKDGWVLDPTNASGDVDVVGFDGDRNTEGESMLSSTSGSTSGTSGSASSSTTSTIASPTVSLPFMTSRDASLCLANEPDGPDTEAGDLLRERNANIGVKEGEVGKQAVYALRAIRKGEELLWDYGASYNREHY